MRKAVVFFKHFGTKSSTRISHPPCLPPSKIRTSLAKVGRNVHCVLPKGEMDGASLGKRLLQIDNKSHESMETTSPVDGGSMQGSPPENRERAYSSLDLGSSEQPALQELPGTPAAWPYWRDLHLRAQPELPSPDADLLRLELSTAVPMWSNVELPTPDLPSYEASSRSSSARSIRPSLSLNVRQSMLAPPVTRRSVQNNQPHGVASPEFETGFAGLAFHRGHHFDDPFVAPLFSKRRDSLPDVSRSEGLVSPISNKNMMGLNSPGAESDGAISTSSVSSSSSPHSCRRASVSISTPHSQAPFRSPSVAPGSMAPGLDPIKDHVWDICVQSLTSEMLGGDLGSSRPRTETVHNTRETDKTDFGLTSEDRYTWQSPHESLRVEDLNGVSRPDTTTSRIELVSSRAELREHTSAEERAAVCCSTIYSASPGVQQIDDRQNADTNNDEGSSLCASGDVLGENTPWPFRDSAISLDDTVTPTHVYVQELCDVVVLAQSELIERLDSSPEPIFKSSALSVDEILRRAMNVLQQYFKGIFENTFEDIFALTQVACAFAYMIHNDEASYRCDAFFEDMLHWQYALAKKSDTILFRKVVCRLSSREALSTTICEGNKPFLNISHKSTLALLGQGRIIKDCVRVLNGETGTTGTIYQYLIDFRY